MGSFILSCPLCCDKTFTSRQCLIEHLTNIVENLCCPHCNNKSSSVVHLIEHLSLDNCQPDEPTSQTIIFDENSHNVENIVIQNSDIKVYQNDNIIDNISETHLSPIQYEVRGEMSDVNSMYVELLSKNPCLQSQELRLVKENGEGRYVILTQDDAELNADNTIVTKQNNDGTISLRTVKDMKRESDAFAATENEVEDNQIYSCNTCKVSFPSVIEHIRNYHNDEDVVVEELADESTDVMSVQYDTLQSEEPSNSDRQPPRRVITDTGDIVEETLFVKIESSPQESNTDQVKEVVNDKTGRGNARRFVQIDKLCDSVVKDINQHEKNGPLHKVMVKEMEGQNGNIVKLYQCMWCDVSVSNLDEFKTRLCTTLKYSCPHCSVSYDNSKSLCAHMKVHKPKPGNESSLSYECGICSTVFPSNKSLKLHKRMHDPVKARPIDPPVENTDGTQVSVGRYRCTVCYKLIPNDYRTIHQNSHDSSEKMDCSICNKKFSSMEYLEMHMNVHTLDKVTVNKQDKSLPYKCLYCSRRFARPHEKVKHERIHTGEKPHSCEICGKSFRVSYCLTLHMRTHTGARPYACMHCGKRFKAHSVYNHHLLTHSDVRAYKCPYCPKAFKTSVQLAGHKNSHTKPFSCQQCNRPFASLYAVRVHTETHAQHINNLKFSCTVCGASYARAFALKDHIKQHHKQDAETAEGMAKQEEVWIERDNAETIEAEETEAVQSIETEEIDDDLNKDLQEEEIQRSLNANEMIIP